MNIINLEYKFIDSSRGRRKKIGLEKEKNNNYSYFIAYNDSRFIFT